MPEGMDTQNAQAAETAPVQEKTFTEDEVNAIVEKRLARERKKYPGEEEVAAFRSWKESQQTEKERWDSLSKERDEASAALAAAQAELEQYKRERLLLQKGVPPGDVDYYAFKIGKLVDDSTPFEKAAEGFLQEHTPEKPGPAATPMRVDLGAPLNGKAPTMTLAERINRELRGQ